MRIVLGTMPQMLREILREVLGDEPDMTVVREVQSDEDLLSAVVREEPDVVVVESAAGDLGVVGARVLRDRPAASVVGLTPDGRWAAIYQLRPLRTVVREVSPAGLREAIRSAVATGTAG